MVKRVLCAVLFLAAGLAYAQPNPMRHPPKYTVATAPACVDGEPKLFAVTDGTGSTDCTVGGGTTEVICKCTDGTAAAVASGGGGSSNSFETINAPAGTDPVADSSTDTLNITCAGGLTCTGTAATDTLDLTMGTATAATALAADPSDCSANQFANAIAASGNLTCAALADADIPDTITASSYVPITLAGQQSITATGAGNDITLTAADDILLSLGAGQNFSVDGGAAGANGYDFDLSVAAFEVYLYDAGATGYYSYAPSGVDLQPATGGYYSLDIGGGTDEWYATESVVASGVPFSFPSYATGSLPTCDGTISGVGAATIAWDSTVGNFKVCPAGVDWLTLPDDDLPDADEVTESMLKAVDTASDEECLTYETTTGDFEWQACGSAGIGGSTGATDNAILAADGAGGATLQARDLTISDVAAGVVTLATTAGNALAVDTTEPAATTGASVAGDPLTISAGNAVASTDTAGAAVGGSVTITAGNAARLTSGNAKGGDIYLTPGSGIGTGTVGTIYIGASSSGVPSITTSGVTTYGIGATPAGFGWIHTNSGSVVYTDFRSNALAFRGGAGDGGGFFLNPLSTAPGVTPKWDDGNTGLGWAGADLMTIIAGGAEIGRAVANVAGVSNGIYALVPVEANTAGSGTPNAIAATESGAVFTNEGTTAANYHALPTAAAGYQFTFIVQDTDGLRIVANTGDTIRIAGTASTAAGYCESTTIGDAVTLVAINATEWIAVSYIGTGFTCA